MTKIELFKRELLLRRYSQSTIDTYCSCLKVIISKIGENPKVDEKTGGVFEFIGSTANLSKSDFADMVTDLIRWSAETFNIVLPLPDEQLEIFE